MSVGTSPSADLGERITARIRRHGPISLAAYMAMALHDPESGYYVRREAIGAAGDFVTAPEISQIFGELIGLWLADVWQRLGAPDPVSLVELGPGRGTLIADLLRSAATLPAFRKAVRPYLVESSPVLRARQQRYLSGIDAHWVKQLDEVPDGPLLLVGNEFFDALPIRQLVRGPTGWAERMVALDAAERLVFADGPESVAAGVLVPPHRRDAPAGTIVEIGPAASALAAAIGERLTQRPGAALLVDYGYGDEGEQPSSPNTTDNRRAGPHSSEAARSAIRLGGSTLRAVREHRPCDPLCDPGMADLSTHVDFAAIAAAARHAGAQAFGPVPQGAFLTALGAEIRLATLCDRATAGQRTALVQGLRRLIDPEQMGKVFQAMALLSPARLSSGSSAPAGFFGSDPPIAAGPVGPPPTAPGGAER